MQEQREALSSLVDPGHSAFLVVDVQRWFTRERPEPMFPPVEDVLRRLRECIDAARAAGVLVIRIQNVIPDEIYSESDLLRVWRRQFPGTHLHFARRVPAGVPGGDPERLHRGADPGAP
jgi:nicotinamidase-related amidase